MHVGIVMIKASLCTVHIFDAFFYFHPYVYHSVPYFCEKFISGKLIIIYVRVNPGLVAGFVRTSVCVPYLTNVRKNLWQLYSRLIISCHFSISSYSIICLALLHWLMRPSLFLRLTHFSHIQSYSYVYISPRLPVSLVSALFPFLFVVFL